MNAFTKLLAVASLAVALAGCQTLASSSGYKFEQVGRPTGTTVSVRLVHADEAPVAGVQLYSVSWQHLGPKATPSQQLTPLQTDAQGNFVYRADDLEAGHTLRLAARIEPNSSLIYGSVEVH